MDINSFDDPVQFEMLKGEYTRPFKDDGVGVSRSTATPENAKVSVLTHEQDHGLDQKGIKAIKTRLEGGINTYNVESAPTEIEHETIQEIDNK